MSINANWERWTLSSFTKLLKSTFQDDVAVNWNVFAGGIDLGEETDHIDVSKPARLAFFVKVGKRQNSGSEYWIKAELVLILTTTVRTSDPFYHSRYVGILESKIPQCLALEKLGSDVGDDASVFCVLNMLRDSDFDPVSTPSIGMQSRVSQSVYTFQYKGVVNAV